MLFASITLAFALAGVHAPAGSQTPVDPMLDHEIWGFGGIGGPHPGPAREPVPPIVAKTWLVAPTSAGASAASVLARWILEPSAPAPIAVDDPAKCDVEAGRWLARPSSDAGEALCAFTVIDSAVAEVRMARLTGAAWMLVNGELFVGDPSRRGFRGVPVALCAGENRIFVAADGARFEFELWKPVTRLVLEAFDIGWPAGTHGDEVTFPLFNASLETAQYVHVHYGHATHWKGECKPCVTEWRDGRYIAPLALYIGASYYHGFPDCGEVIDKAARDVFVPVCVYSEEGELADRRLLRRAGDRTNNFETVDRLTDAFSGNLGLLSEGVHVYGTRGTAEESSAALAAARFQQQLSWYHRGTVPLVMSDVDYLEDTRRSRNAWHAEDKNVALHGNADTNAAWSRLVPDYAPLDARRGRVKLDGVEHTGEDLAGWYVLDTKGVGVGVFALFDTGVRGARLGSYLALTWREPAGQRALFECDEPTKGTWRRISETTGR